MTSIFETRIQFFLNKLYEKSVENRQEIKQIGYVESGYKTNDVFPSANNVKVYSNDTGWGGKRDSHYWFVFEVDVPTNFSDYVLKVNTDCNVWHASNPQFIVYIDEKIVQGLDENHTEISFSKSGRQTVWLYAYTGSEVDDVLKLFVSLDKIRFNLRKLFYELYVLYEVVDFSKENERAYKANLAHINHVFSLIDFNDYISDETIEKSIEYLEKNSGRELNDSETVYCVGQTHIDVEWLWSLRQTKEKVQRSFTNVINLLNKHPDYTFFASTPVIYEYIKETQPQVFEEIKKRIKDGSWDADGATYVECDNVLSGGESLIRQFYYGKKYFKEEFGIDSKILWLPDCFGFSGALPQIAKSCGIEWFVTSKISWNDTNQFPHDIFLWKGIDGSGLKTYFLTTQGKYRDSYVPVTVYNGMGNPRQIRGTYDRLTDKELSDVALTTYGWGDGGGGPAESMYRQMDYMRRGVVGLPKLKISTVKGFFNDLDGKLENKNLPVWKGELYFEYHRGTPTAVSNAKKGNRKVEELFSKAEFLCALNKDNSEKETMDELWKKLLVHQFHDALPGSSIKDVYDDMQRDFEYISDELNGIIGGQIQKIIRRKDLSGDAVVFNYNSRPQSGIVVIDDKEYFVENVPPKGYKTVELKQDDCKTVFIGEKSLENEFYKVVFNDSYEIVELFDKRVGRNVVADGGTFNALNVYNDINVMYDAWELPEYYRENVHKITAVESVEKVVTKHSAGFKIVKSFRSSKITQTISLYSRDDLINFDTELEWNEHDVILKAEFDTDIKNDTALYNIQFGNIERSTLDNTSYEKAQFEVPMHKYMDYAENGYGLAIINDCKYGGFVKNGLMSLSLLKCAHYPYADSEKGIRTFSYALYPHTSGITHEGVLDKAYAYNYPLTAVKLNGKNVAKEFSYVTVDSDDVFIETVKNSYDKKGVIIRAYDGMNKKTKARFTLGRTAKKVVECDMLENELSVIAENVTEFCVFVKNYEIKTLKVIYE